MHYDPKHRVIDFEVCDFIFLKVKPVKGTTRFRQRGKLAPRYIRSFEVIKKINKVTYMLALPANMSDIHNIFHASMLRKWVINAH